MVILTRVTTLYGGSSGSSVIHCGTYSHSGPAGKWHSQREKGGTGSPGSAPGTGHNSPAFFLLLLLGKFHYLSLLWHYMHDITSSKKMENGIVVFWDEKGEKKDESFNYQELIDMKINALDLLDRPKSYKIDKAAHKLIIKK
jgi:hypothetical protein